LISKFAFKVHDGVVGNRATDQASHKLLSVRDEYESELRIKKKHN